MKTEYRILKRAKADGEDINYFFVVSYRNQKQTNNPFLGSKIVWGEWRDIYWLPPFPELQQAESAVRRLQAKDKACSISDEVVFQTNS